MEQRVMISLSAIQKDGSGKDETMELETPGVYREDERGQSISYGETKISGMEGTTTTLFFSDDCVRLVRDGTILQDQEYRVGETTSSPYRTPLGELTVSATTKRVENGIRDGRGKLLLAYDVSLAGLFRHYNEIIVEIREDSEHPWKSGKH